MKFQLSIDLTGQEHPENPRAMRAFIVMMLNQAGQAIGSGEAMAGDLTAGGAFSQSKIGAWTLIKDAPDDPREALTEVLTGA